MTEPDYVKHIQAWKNEEVLKLANHFHNYCQEGSKQHKRVHHFEMSSNLVREFTRIKNIKELKICLAINSDVKESNFTFYPILEIKTGEANHRLHLESFAYSEDEFLSELVPEIFKDMIQDNWDKLDISYIDDLFIAQARNDKGVPLNQMIRVHEFIIGKKMIAHINALNVEVENSDIPPSKEPNIQKIKLYPGVDMNKFGNKKLISFTPVLGFTRLKSSLQVHNEMGIQETAKNETFIEYSRPCPPTCKPPDLYSSL